MNIETAEATRHCHLCHGKILRGEEHIAKYVWRYGWKSRRNYCLRCTCSQNTPQAKEVLSMYIAQHPDRENFVRLKCIQQGVRL